MNMDDEQDGSLLSGFTDFDLLNVNLIFADSMALTLIDFPLIRYISSPFPGNLKGQGCHFIFNSLIDTFPKDRYQLAITETEALLKFILFKFRTKIGLYT